MATRSSSGSHPGCLARRALDQRRGKLLDAESHRAAEVDVREVNWADATQPFVLDLDPVALEPLDCRRLLVYGALLWLSFHALVLAHEEPTLEQTFGLAALPCLPGRGLLQEHDRRVEGLARHIRRREIALDPHIF